jgi:hypothetical protein
MRGREAGEAGTDHTDIGHDLRSRSALRHSVDPDANRDQSGHGAANDVPA